MDSSRRAVESYWRSRMIDAVTSDEDKVAPVYKLDEICDLLRTSHPSIVKEVSDFILHRLDHKSPIVKQKALRLIKYAVPKSGSTDFRREMQRHSVSIKQLFHYKGHPDPLKGDALNKAVRDTAHQAVSSIFATDGPNTTTTTNKTPAVAAPHHEGGSLGRRIQGFGNTNYEMHPPPPGSAAEDKKSFLSEVVGLGLSTIAAANSSIRKSDNGSYKSPTLRRSLTTEMGGRERYYEAGDDDYTRGGAYTGGSAISRSGTWSADTSTSIGSSTAAVVEDGLGHSTTTTGSKSREERLLDTIVTSGGVRLQPTRDAVQAFLVEAAKMDGVSMSHAIEMKLQSPLWQVRMKACCILESILRKKDDDQFSIISTYFSENRDSLVKCSDLPQVSLREKASKVLSLLNGDRISVANNAGEMSDAKQMPVPAVQMPDLIDTGEPDDYGIETSAERKADESMQNLTSPGPLVDDLLGGDPFAGLSTTANGNRNEDDPFADVSFLVTEDKQHDDIFSGLTIGDSKSDNGLITPTCNMPISDVFSSKSEHLLQERETDKKNVHELMAGLSLNGTAQDNRQPVASGLDFSVASSLGGSNQSSQIPTNGVYNASLGSSSFYPLAPMQYNIPPNMMFSQASTQPINYSAMGAFIAQQQLLYQNIGNFNAGYAHTAENAMEGGYSSALPDIFQPSNNPVRVPGAVLTSTKKEDTKAFDFISDHLSAARDSKRVL